MPFVPASTWKALIEDFSLPSRVCAKTVKRPANDALEMNRFCPFRTHPCPFRSARVLMDLASDPESGSRQRESSDELAARKPRHETVLLCWRPRAQQALACDTVMNADEVAHGRTGASKFEGDFHFLDRVEAQPAIALRIAKPEQAEAAHFVEKILGRGFQLGDFTFSRNQPLSNEPLDRVAEQHEGFCVDWHQFALAVRSDRTPIRNQRHAETHSVARSCETQAFRAIYLREGSLNIARTYYCVNSHTCAIMR
jgi:hypothetical protein